MSATATRLLYGFPFVDAPDFTEVVERILGPQPDDARTPLVVTPNVDDLVRLSESRYEKFADAERRARYVLPDGQPIVWSSRILREPLAARLPGSSLFPLLWDRIVAENRRAMVIAPSEEIADLMRADHPALGVVVPPFFDPEQAGELDEVLVACNAVLDGIDPEYVLIGIGFPKQQHLALGMIERLMAAGRPLPLFLLLGGSFDLHYGRTRRAPRWVQRAGFEWFFRFVMEPRRLFRRYFVTDMRFARMFVDEFTRTRRVPHRPSPLASKEALT